MTGSTGQEQLKHEAAVLSQLHHPNLPAFLDAFMEHGRYYIVLSYIEGRDLTDLLRMTRQRNEIVPIAQILSWLLSICDAVMFLHSQYPIVIHRDIKPDNIRITPNGTAILVDLGNAKAAADGARTLFFIRHQGTPGYAPPEQYPGGSGTDARSDIYALGATLYFALLAQEPPSVSKRNESLQQRKPDLPTLQERLASNPPESAGEAAEARQFRLGISKPAKPAPRHSRHVAQLGTLPSELLDRLNRIIHKAMAMKPERRYQYVSDFAADLKAVLAALPPPPQPPSSSRKVDPHSTQPDLPGIYEVLRSQKEQAKQQGSEGRQVANPPAPPPSVPPIPADSCPRCQAPLAPRAAYCPRCGTPLGGNRGSNRQQNSMPPSSSASQAPPVPSTPPASLSAPRDVSAEETVVVKYKPPKQTTVAQSPAQSAHGLQMQMQVQPPAGRQGMLPPHLPQTPQTPPPAPAQAPSLPAMTPMPQMPPTPPNGKSASAASSNTGRSGFTITPMLIIIVAAILVLLLIVMTFLLTGNVFHTHSGLSALAHHITALLPAQ
ncbi:MAG: protein kinase [Ktedonobacteraceae bacterium]|nr:protein kinase [Ktedonobacteraceae bacterium]